MCVFCVLFFFFQPGAVGGETVASAAPLKLVICVEFFPSFPSFMLNALCV